MNIEIEFGRGIELLRRERNVSKKELALSTGIDEANLNRIISGKQWPTKPRLKALCEYFHLPPSDLFKVAEEGGAYLAEQQEIEQLTQQAAKLIGAAEAIQEGAARIGGRRSPFGRSRIKGKGRQLVILGNATEKTQKSPFELHRLEFSPCQGALNAPDDLPTSRE